MGRHRLTKKRVILLILAACLLLAMLALVACTSISKKSSANQPLKEFQQRISFPIYYPSQLPSYFFVDVGSAEDTNNTLIFPITRNDGQKIIVTEQPLPTGYDLSGVSGLQHTIKGVGVAVIGSGFLSQRAVLATPKTLILLSAAPQIPFADLQRITYAFRQL